MRTEHFEALDRSLRAMDPPGEVSALSVGNRAPGIVLWCRDTNDESYPIGLEYVTEYWTTRTDEDGNMWAERWGGTIGLTRTEGESKFAAMVLRQTRRGM